MHWSLTWLRESSRAVLFGDWSELEFSLCFIIQKRSISLLAFPGVIFLLLCCGFPSFSFLRDGAFSLVACTIDKCTAPSFVTFSISLHAVLNPSQQANRMKPRAFGLPVSSFPARCSQEVMSRALETSAVLSLDKAITDDWPSGSSSTTNVLQRSRFGHRKAAVPCPVASYSIQHPAVPYKIADNSRL